MIKIITGVRRCGKSKLLVLFERYLVKSGVSRELIHKIDLDVLSNAKLLDPMRLHDHVKSILIPGGILV